MYRKVSLSSFHNGKVEYCTTSGSGDIEENASPVFFFIRLYINKQVFFLRKNERYCMKKKLTILIQSTAFNKR